MSAISYERKILTFQGTAMITPQTVQQLLEVCRNFRDNHASGMPLHRSYKEAVHTVANAHSVFYQTIGDGCRKRLRLSNIREFHELLAAWVKGDARGLVRQLKENSDPSAHAEIDQFFSGGQPAPTQISKASPKGPLRNETETFSFRLPERDARMLKALAELEGVSVGELTARVVSAAVRNRMKVLARGIVKNAEARA